MHSFQPSRGRILFEVFCTLGIVASCVGAWQQTGASALLAAAAVSGLYGFARLLDLARPNPAEAAEPQRIDFEPEVPDIVVPMVGLAQQPTVETAVEEEIVEVAEVVESPPSRSGSGRRSGGSRKGSGRRSKAQKESKVVELAPVVETDLPWPVAGQAERPEVEPPAEAELAFLPDEEDGHPHIAPLFEPAPYVHVRQQRAAFGRKSR